MGGFGEVTQNMFVYETDKEILLVDCGVGFPEEEMMGVDLVIPDITYLKEKAKTKKIVGLLLSHGHDDHIGGLPYILPQLPSSLPIFAPKWALALSRAKLEEFGLSACFQEINEKSQLTLGQFKIEFIQVTHSIPDTYHLVITTPIGVVYHAADFKLDLHPVIGPATNQEKIKKVGQRGVFCLLSDCLRAENPGFTPPEAKLEEMFAKEMATTKGRFLVTTISSNISRLKQAVDVSLRQQRQVVLVGRSVEKNFRLAEKLGYLHFPKNAFLDKKKTQNYPANKLTFLVAGSQGQVGSALDRMVAGDVKGVQIKPGDKVVFSTDYIPGNEKAIYSLIDNIYRLGGEVVYQDIRSNVHVSGHGSQGDLAKLIKMVKPHFLLPIGGNFRHLVAYQKLAQKEGWDQKRIILADDGQVVTFSPSGQLNMGQKIDTRQVMVDALGVGDVGRVVLRDRQILAEEGMVVVVLPLDQNRHALEGEPVIVTRGFIYIKKNLGLLAKTKNKIRQTIAETESRQLDYRFVRRRVCEKLEKFFFKETGRQPMVLAVIVEV